LDVAEAGIPVVVVPGNHERSRIPHDRFSTHPNIHLFREPSTVGLSLKNARVALSGFPYHRKGIRESFPALLEKTDWRSARTDLRLLCIHHCVEGATVGPSDYTFRSNPDVIRCSDLPGDFAAVLSGHIHRHQLLRKDLRGNPLETPVFYPGSVERTAFAEVGEEKGFLIMDLDRDDEGGRVLESEFVKLPARPMVVLQLQPTRGEDSAWSPEELVAQLSEALSAVPSDAVLQLRVHGRVPPTVSPHLSAARLREKCPDEMNVQLILPGHPPERHTRTRAGRRRTRQKGVAGSQPSPDPATEQTELPWTG
jgi:DNA repair exonuclease SbcCD nuclease subunit